MLRKPLLCCVCVCEMLLYRAVCVVFFFEFKMLICPLSHDSE